MRGTVQNTGYQDAPGTHCHKKDPGKNEGCIK